MRSVAAGRAFGAAVLLLALFAGVGSAALDGSREEPPANRRPPRVTGAAEVGVVLEASRGTWLRARGALLSYQWSACDADGAECADVVGATDGIFPARPADVGRTLRVAVTVETNAGRASAESAATPVVREAPAGAPVVTDLPGIEGKAEIGAVLTADRGSWKGGTTERFGYQWRRCAADGGACKAVSRATKETYVLSEPDVGHALRVLVKAGNSVGTGAALSGPTDVVEGPPNVGAPRSTTPPVISGVPRQGQSLAVSSGSWNGATPMTFMFRWLRCDRGGDRCVRIRQAVEQTYKLVEADVGHAVRARVTASNAAGSGSTVSDRTQVVVRARAPVNGSLPKISGTARESGVLTASSGRWRGDRPIRLSYQWLRCNDTGEACVTIPGASARTRTVTSADVGHVLRVRVTATNSAGSATALSAPSAVVASKGTAPANRSAPILAGTPLQGERLTLSSGTWTGTQPIAYSYSWQRCGASLADCRRISGATGSTYVLTRSDVGHRLYGIVTARNSAGATSAGSNTTAVVVGVPFNTAPPRISGSPVEGQVLSAATGSWDGVRPITFGYQWTRCSATGEFSSCKPIVVTSRSTYTLRAPDVGHRIFVQVKALNRFGASYVNSALTPVVTAAPIGSVTIRSTRDVVVYGNAVTLTGRAVGAPAGEPVTIVEQPIVGGARVHSRAAVTRSGGTWTWVGRPTTRATYRAVVRDRESSRVTVRVEPRLELKKKRGTSKLTLRVYAPRSYTNRKATLQRWNGKRRQWVVVQRVRLRSARALTPPTMLTSTTFRAKAKRGAVVRMVLPSGQTGKGYIKGVSNLVRF